MTSTRTSTLEHDLADYLRAQADRVEVTSTLDTIEHDLIYLPRAPHDRTPHRLAPLLALASAVLMIVALSVVAARAETTTSSGLAAASDDIADDAGVAPLAATTATLPAPPEPAPPVHVPLPDGAVLNGVAPTCTATFDPVVFECTIAAFPESLGTLDYTGYTSIIVDDTSHVSGGCRATNPDATAYLCFIGTRAVDELIVGENYLGDWAPREYAAG